MTDEVISELCRRRWKNSPRLLLPGRNSNLILMHGGSYVCGMDEVIYFVLCFEIHYVPPAALPHYMLLTIQHRLSLFPGTHFNQTNVNLLLAHERV